MPLAQRLRDKGHEWGDLKKLIPDQMSQSVMGYELIKDQFVLGDNIIVAQVTERGARSKKVVLPKGKWKAEDGQIFKGGKAIEISVPLERLPYFRKIN